MSNDWAFKNTKAIDWGPGIDKLDFRLFHKVDLLVDVASKMINNPVGVTIHQAWADSGHTENSQHYLGKAVDLHLYLMNEFKLPVLLEIQMLAALRSGFTGIGLYPEWHNFGLHCDVRDLSNGQEVIMWIQRGGKYLPLTSKELVNLP